MNQIAQQGKDMLEIVEKYEVPQEYHAALWAAYKAGADLGFFKALGIGSASDSPQANTATSKLASPTTPVNLNQESE